MEKNSAEQGDYEIVLSTKGNLNFKKFALCYLKQNAIYHGQVAWSLNEQLSIMIQGGTTGDMMLCQLKTTNRQFELSSKMILFVRRNQDDFEAMQELFGKIQFSTRADKQREFELCSFMTAS